jgi:defect in organelle trafficking protein DotD
MKQGMTMLSTNLRYHTRLAYSVCVVVCCLLLASCTFHPNPPSPPPPELTTHAQIVQAADKVDRTLNSLNEVERSKRPENLFVKADPSPEPIHPSLSRVLDIEWSGPVQPLLQDIAMLTDYRLKVIGNPPAIPVLVNLAESDITAHGAIRHARAQVYLRADILVFPDSGIIELHYLDV